VTPEFTLRVRRTPDAVAPALARGLDMKICNRYLMTLAASAVLGACGGGSGDTAVPVAPPAPAAVTIVTAGDIAQCGSAPAAASAAASTARLVSAQDGAVLTLGDTTYPVGALSEFLNCFEPTWGAFKSRIRPVPGNHEYMTPGAEGYFTYFGAQAGPSDRRGYYSYDYAGWHFIALNSNVDAAVGSAQYNWLVADLAASKSVACTIAYWHYPVFSSARHGSLPEMKDAFRLLQTSGAEIVLSGHDHVYERFAPQTADGVADAARGIRQFVVGTGGASLYEFKAPLPNSEFRNNTNHGVLRLTLRSDGYSWQFIPASGAAALDSGTGTCHP
jgi:hypothetical protein